jgi:hypothetical protein
MLQEIQMECFKDYGTVHGVGMALFKEQENDIFSRNLYDCSFKKVKMAGFKQNQLQGSGNPDCKVQEIQVVRTKKYRWQGSMKTGGQDQEIKLARFKKSR